VVIGAPKPTNWSELVAAWNEPATWRRLVADYRRQVAAERTAETRDITEPLHEREEIR
jgi:hypothetical protein